MIFVFGSNVLGIHGAGAAKHAYENCGAKWGIGFGHHGNSFAIPTKWTPWKFMSVTEIAQFVDLFLHYAKTYPNLQFQLTPIGCGLAGHSPKDIAPMFANSPSNVHLPKEFEDELRRVSKESQ